MSVLEKDSRKTLPIVAIARRNHKSTKKDKKLLMSLVNTDTMTMIVRYFNMYLCTKLCVNSTRLHL